MAAVELRAASRCYGSGGVQVRALDAADLTVEAGEFAVIQGPSGSGKTTLLNLVSGLDKPTSGRVFVDGLDLTELGDGDLSRFRNRRIGYVFQAFYLEANQSALSNVELPLVFAQVPAKERARRAAEILQRLGLGDRLHLAAKNLSAGQKQRVALARAVVNRPGLLLADEPTANLDSKTGDEILDLISDLQKKDGTTVLLVTHDRHFQRPGVRRLWVQDGKLSESPAIPEPI